jgi:hypothetical protein
VSTQGLTYPHDLDLSSPRHALLRRINDLSNDAAKSLISLMSLPCRESGQAVAKPVTTSLSQARRAVLHKVIPSSGGEAQKPASIIDLAAIPQARGDAARSPCRLP